MFTIDSIHKGTIVGVHEKGVIVALPYGVEGFSPSRHSFKADKTKLQVDDTADFKVLEFSKENKRILVSHTATYSEFLEEPQKPKTERTDKPKSVRRQVKDVRKNLEKTTLGDIDALSSLKSDLDKSEVAGINTDTPKKTSKSKVRSKKSEKRIESKDSESEKTEKDA